MDEKTPAADDLQIIKSVLNGNTQAFNTIVKRYENMVFKVCVIRLVSNEEAEDAMQEIFIRVFRSLKTFKQDSNFKTWLYSITINFLKTQFSRIQRIGEIQERVEIAYSPEQKGPMDFVLQNETLVEIQHAINLLPEHLKDVVEYYYMKNLKVFDIAEVLKLSRENVKIMLYRARIQLKEILSKNSIDKSIK